MITEEHEMVRKVAREFAEREVVQIAQRMDFDDWYPRELIREAGKLGLVAPTLPEQYGGPGMDLRATVVALEELAKMGCGFSLILEVLGSLVAHTVFKYGGNRHREEILPKIASGDLVASFALSEPCCGSDAANIMTSARRERGEWVINGVKTWITNGMYADYYVIAARTGPREERHKTITLFLLKHDNKCITRSPIKVMGCRGTGTAEIRFEDCTAGDDDIIGGLNKGFQGIAYALNVGRTAISAIAVGLAEAAYEEALEWARGRELFGKRLIEFQNTQFELAEMKSAIELGRLATYYSAYLFDERRAEFLLYTHIAKLYTARMCVEVTRRAMQLEGAFGYSKESRVERFYRDAKLMEIGEGTNEVMKYVLAKFIEWGLPKFEF